MSIMQAHDEEPGFNTHYMVGTCTTMCPKAEMILREKVRLLHKFEIKSGTENKRYPEADPDKVIKCYSRSAAGHQTKPSDLRPLPVLMKTIKYLYHEIFPHHKEQPLTVYNFMFDRFRSVRQDMVIQNFTSYETIGVLEPIARFHVYFGYVLIEEDEKDFDVFINNTHLQECLKRLLVCYDEVGEDDFVERMSGLKICNGGLKNRQDIEAVYLLFNLSHFDAMTRGVKLYDKYVNGLVIELSFSWYLKNFIRVLRLITELPPLLLCVVVCFMPEIRKHCLMAYSQAFSSPNCAYPISHLKSLLFYGTESELLNDLEYFNVKVKGANVSFQKKDFNISAKTRNMKRISWIDDVLLNTDVVKLLCYGCD